MRSSMRCLVSAVLLAFAVALGFPGISLAQGQATLEGRVVDTSGGGVAGARVTATNTGTGAQFESTSDAD